MHRKGRGGRTAHRAMNASGRQYERPHRSTEPDARDSSASSPVLGTETPLRAFLRRTAAALARRDRASDRCARTYARSIAVYSPAQPGTSRLFAYKGNNSGPQAARSATQAGQCPGCGLLVAVPEVLATSVGWRSGSRAGGS